MAQHGVKTPVYAQSEYMVYIYHRPENQIEGQSDWEMRTRSDDLKSAVEEARRLLESRNFKKIEIKQRTWHPRTNMAQDHTVKTLENNSRSYLSAALKFLGCV